MNHKTVSLIFFLLIMLGTTDNFVFGLELGVGTHFGQGRGDSAFAFTWMKSAGMTSFRDEIYWGSIESQPSKFTLNANAQLSFNAFSEAKAKGINPILILGYGNPLYDNGSQPSSNKGRAAFAAYAAWLSQHLKDKVEYFEIWNEWNLGAGTVPKNIDYGSPDNYVKLTSVTYDAIKKENPATKVIVGAIGNDLEEWSWLKAAIKAGLLKKADGISVHLYNHSMPKSQAGAAEIIKRLRDLQTLLRNKNGGMPVPIYITETGWPTHWGLTGVSERVAAEQDARLLLEAYTLEDLAGIWWYELIDGGNNPFERENRFGLLTTSLQEKPTGCRLLSLIPFVKQAQLTQNIGKGNTRALLFTDKAKKALLAVWAGNGYTDTVTEVEIHGSFGNAKAFDQDCGDRVTTGLKKTTANTIQIQAGSYPTLVWVGAETKLTKIVSK